MTKINTNLPDPKDLTALAEKLGDALGALDKGVSFGTPQDPASDASTTLAGTAAANHPGTLENMTGSWVEVEVEALDTAVTCYHNLDVPIVSAAEPNVRWIVMGLQHDGGQGTWWDDLRVPMTAVKVGGSAPGWAQIQNNGAGSTGVFAYLFDAGSEEEVHFAAQLPHGWEEATTIKPHVHWSPVAAGNPAEVVAWGLEYTWANVGGDFGNTTIISANTHTPADGSLVADRHYITALDDIAGTGKTISSMLVCRLFRDATGALDTDDYGSDAALLEFDFHIELDAPGSDAATSKTSGVALDAQSVSVRYDPTDTVAANSIQLRFNAHPSLLVNGSNKLKVSLFFIPAVR